MRKWSAVGVFLLPLLFGLGLASPDLGLDISIDFVTMNNPNVRTAADVVLSATADLNGAIGGYVVPKLNGSTTLAVSGQSLVTLVSSITGTVNNVLRNISVIASQRQTAPSCMFATVNATIDEAYGFLDTAGALVTSVRTSTSSQLGNALSSATGLLTDTLGQIASYLDALYKQVVAVLATGTVTTSSVNSNIQQSTLIQLSGSIAVATTVEKSLSTTVRSIRTAFEQANNILTSYNNDLASAFVSVNNTQRDYYNQITSRVTSFQSKVTLETNSGMSEILSTRTRLNQFIQDTVTRTTAQALDTSIVALNTSVQALATGYFNNIRSQITQIFIGAETFVKANIESMVVVFNSSSFKLAETMSLGGSYAANCNAKYGGAILNLDNNMRDGLNRCMNEYANTGYTDAFVSEFNQVIREQLRTLAARINFCLNLGTTTSNTIVKAGISRCFTEMVAMNDALLKDVGFQTTLIVSAINLEGLAMIQRLESCSVILNHGLVAKAGALDVLLASCQTSNT